jgi:hypothetical protein
MDRYASQTAGGGTILELTRPSWRKVSAWVAGQLLARPTSSGGEAGHDLRFVFASVPAGIG